MQLLDALAHLHKLRILHRDLKTANAFLTHDGKTLKLGDMNISKLAKDGLVKTQIGTPYYMSPEIWANRPYDAKSDVWAAGCILYEMAALRPPFRGRDVEELARVVQRGVHPPLPGTYSSELAQVVSALLVVSPRRRPSAAEVLAMPAVARRRNELLAGMDETVRCTGSLDIVVSLLCSSDKYISGVPAHCMGVDRLSFSRCFHALYSTADRPSVRFLRLDQAPKRCWAPSICRQLLWACGDLVTCFQPRRFLSMKRTQRPCGDSKPWRSRRRQLQVPWQQPSRVPVM